MPLFHYKARNGRGDPVEGQIEAASADAVAAQLFNTGITPIEIRETTSRTSAGEQFKKLFASQKPGTDDLLLLCRQMYALTKAGVPLIRGITGLAETSRNAVLADALKQIRQELESGRELSAAMAQHPEIFTPLMISLVRVGENTGQLEEAFLQLSQYLELDRDTRSRVKMALRYPVFVLIAISVAIAIINIKVIPAFAKVFAGFHAQLPWQTRLLVSISDFFVAYWPWMFAALVGAFFTARNYVRTEKGRYEWDKFKLGIPHVGDIILRATLARFARAFAMTVSSGVPLIQALTVTARAVDNEYIAERILAMRTGVERGDSLVRTAQATGMFTPLVIQMMAVGEETGSVDTMMTEVAAFYEREVDYDVKNLSSAIEPVMIVIVGIMVLVLALGVFLPMWDLASATRGGR